MYSGKILEAGSRKLRRCQDWLSLQTFRGSPLLSLPASGWLRQSLAYDCLTLLSALSAHGLSSLFQVSFYLSLFLSSLAALTSFSCVLEWNPKPCTSQARALPLSPIPSLPLLRRLHVQAGEMTQWFRVHTAFAETPNLTPHPEMVTHLSLQP